MVCIIDTVIFYLLGPLMSRYYCPFCSSRYQYQKIRSDGILICGQCGDPLIRKPLINLRKICGLIVASAFLLPLIIMIIFVFQESTNEKSPSNSDTLVLLTFN